MYTLPARTMDCECSVWGGCLNEVDGGHHVSCPKAPMQLVRRLRDGMRAWARDEDGVHYHAWDAYADACVALGEPRPEPEA